SKRAVPSRFCRRWDFLGNQRGPVARYRQKEPVMIQVPSYAECPAMSAASTQCVFRDVRTQTEMRDSLALRYRLYSETYDNDEFGSLIHSARLDLDVFDLTSHH